MRKFVAKINYFLSIKGGLILPHLTKEKASNKLKSILKEICEATNFNYGEIWLLDCENNLLELSPNYYTVADANQHDLELFHKCSEGFIMSRGEGLPGRVFSSKKSEWMLDVSVESEESFLRNKIAGICGVKTGFAIPVIKENKVLMIIAFFSVQSVCYCPQYLSFATDIATKLLPF